MPTIISKTILLIIVCLLAQRSDKTAVKMRTDDGYEYCERSCVWLIIVALSFYAAMRTMGNDTTAYIRNFVSRTPTLAEFFGSGQWLQEKGAFFTFLNIIVKYYIADNYHIFFLIAALITNGALITFLRKYTPYFSVALFLYMTMDGYGVTLTGMRQAMATALALWLIPLAKDRKWLRFIILFLICYEIHFVSILYIFVPFFLSYVWNKSSIITVILTILAAVYFERFTEIMLDTSEALGFSYSTSIVQGSSINVFRVLVYMVAPILAWLSRWKMNEKSKVIRCMANMSIVASAFVFLGMFGKANTFGRFGLEFESSMYTTLPESVHTVGDDMTETLIIRSMIACFLIYAVFGYMKNGITADFYGLESVFKWFAA